MNISEILVVVFEKATLPPENLTIQKASNTFNEFNFGSFTEEITSKSLVIF